ncbi:MAG: putative tellurite resistance protein B-like protein [Bacteroidia bacterium]|jgi:uncharacterized tellurite resistance protein B-like protein
MTKAKYNKDISGYLILSILAESDGNFDAREGSVIVGYIQKNFPLGGNLERATEELSLLTSSDHESRLIELAQDFYGESTSEERTQFLRFAMLLVRADDEIADEENTLITRLFEAWDI